MLIHRATVCVCPLDNEDPHLVGGVQWLSQFCRKRIGFWIIYNWNQLKELSVGFVCTVSDLVLWLHQISFFWYTMQNATRNKHAKCEKTWKTYTFRRFPSSFPFVPTSHWAHYRRKPPDSQRRRTVDMPGPREQGWGMNIYNIYTIYINIYI